MNAVINKLSNNLKNCSLYVTLFPCNECAKLIIQSHITRIIYLEDTDESKRKYSVSKIMLNNNKGNISCDKYEPLRDNITLNFKGNNSK